MAIDLHLHLLVLLVALVSVVLVTPYYIIQCLRSSKRSRSQHLFPTESSERNTSDNVTPSALVGPTMSREFNVKKDYGIIQPSTAIKTEDMDFRNVGGNNNSTMKGISVYLQGQMLPLPSAPPLSLANVTTFTYFSPGPENVQGYNLPPPSYSEAIATGNDSQSPDKSGDDNRRVILGANDLEWYQVFNAFNEKRMAIATQWIPPPASERQLNKRLEEINRFINSEEHPVSAQGMYKFLKSFNILTNLVYAQSSLPSARRINVSDTVLATGDDDAINTNITWHTTHRDTFLKSFSLLMKKYVPNEAITNRVVPFGYDWFIFSGRMTYTIINAHIALCTLNGEAPSTRPYYSENSLVDTRIVARGLKNICKNFTESLGYERHSSNRVFIGTAFLYASLLERACLCFAETDAPTTTFSPAGLLPDYLETLNEILYNPANRYDSFKTLVDEIGKSNIPRVDVSVAGEENNQRRRGAIPTGADKAVVTYDGIYDDRTFIAHRRLRMYSYIHSYCEQLLSVQLLLREKWLTEDKMTVLLRAVEPMSDEGALFYFNLHSRTGTFKYRNGSALFATLGISEFRSGQTTGCGSVYGRVYVADKSQILFVQSGAFTFHAIGQLSDLAFGEVEKANRDLMPAWLMGQRPLFRSERNKLVDVPCGAHLEPCVIDTGKSRDLQMGLIKQRNTTTYTPTEARSALVAFEEQNIGAVFTVVREINMDVHYSRCTVATPYYTFTTYFRITRNNHSDTVGDDENIHLSCYTGSIENNTNIGADDADESGAIHFKHCTVQVFVQTRNGTDYEGESVTLARREEVVKRAKSKSKYTSDELRNVSLSLAPFGYNSNPQLPGSVTILYRPISCKTAPIPSSLVTRKITPNVTTEEENVYRIQVDSRHVVYCDSVRNIVVLLDVMERRGCVAPILSTAHDDPHNMDRVDLLESAAITLHKDGLGTIKFDSFCNNRIYTYFEDTRNATTTS